MEMTLKLTDNAEKRLWRMYEYFYFFVLTLALLDTYLQITMFCGVRALIPVMTAVTFATDMLTLVLLVLGGSCVMASLFKKAPAPFAFSTQEAIAALVCCGLLLVPYFLCGYEEPFWFAVFILGARGIEQKKLIRFYFIISVIICSLTFLCGITGLIENLVYHRGDGTIRIAFGFNYPTDFCSHIFFLVVCWLWLRMEKTSYYEIAGIAALAVFTYFACHARTTSATLMLLAMWMIVVKLRARRNNGQYTMTKPLQTCCFLAPPLAALFMTVSSVFYSDQNRFFTLIDKFTNSRLSQGHIGFLRYNPTLFGQAVDMNGNGGSVELPTDYFFLDCTYVNTLLRYGLFALLVLLFSLFYLTLSEKHKKAFVHVGLLGIVALQCVIEQHLMELGHSPLLLLLLTYDGEAGGFDLLRFLKSPTKSST